MHVLSLSLSLSLSLCHWQFYSRSSKIVIFGRPLLSSVNRWLWTSWHCVPVLVTVRRELVIRYYYWSGWGGAWGGRGALQSASIGGRQYWIDDHELMWALLCLSVNVMATNVTEPQSLCIMQLSRKQAGLATNWRSIYLLMDTIPPGHWAAPKVWTSVWPFCFTDLTVWFCFFDLTVWFITYQCRRS